MRLFLLSVFAAASFSVAAQTAESCYSEQMKAGEKNLQGGKLYEALECSFLAEKCFSSGLPDEQAKALKAFRAKVKAEIERRNETIKKVKAESEEHQQKVRLTQAQLDSVKSELKRQKEELATSKSDLAKEKALFKKKQQEFLQVAAFQRAFHFYYDKWAIVYMQEDKAYSYVNKQGYPLNGNRYSRIDSFDTHYHDLAYAIDTTAAKKGYYLDTLGNECLAAKKVSEINENTGLIDLRNQNLKEFPPAIANCKKLRYLLLSGNQIKLIPDYIGKMESLLVLSLAGNQITEIPESIGALKKLQVLYLAGNALVAMPESMTNLTSLKHVFIDKAMEPMLRERMGETRPMLHEKW